MKEWSFCAILDDVDVVEGCFEMLGFYTPVDEGFRCKTQQLRDPEVKVWVHHCRQSRNSLRRKAVNVLGNFTVTPYGMLFARRFAYGFFSFRPSRLHSVEIVKQIYSPALTWIVEPCLPIL